MTHDIAVKEDAVYALNKGFVLDYPKEAARKIETMEPDEAFQVLSDMEIDVIVPVFSNLAPGVADSLFESFPTAFQKRLMVSLETGLCVALLSRFPKGKRENFLATLDKAYANEIKELLDYPDDTAGRIMEPKIIAFNENHTVGESIQQLKFQKVESLHHLFLLDNQGKLCGQVDIQKIVLAEKEQLLSSLSFKVKAYVNTLEMKDEIIEKFEKHKVDILPVIDVNDNLVGVIRGQNMMEAMREEVATDMQTMVGVSKDERALSPSLFAVKKRLPWLQINLLTAFLAAAVVGLFEDTIAKFTALAILLPVAAGQAGNAGAQALAVTMRGLFLREITLRDWFRIAKKEAGTGLLNGLGIAVTCSIGVFVWSQSYGLALVMALAMTISMTIAGISGALVPLALKRFGLDPAQSSSIVLTTITDIAGFLSFLGIATLLSGFL